MKKLLVSLALVCALTPSAFAGDTHQPGDDCAPETVCAPPDEGSTSAPPFIVIVVNGELIIVYTF